MLCPELQLAWMLNLNRAVHEVHAYPNGPGRNEARGLWVWGQPGLYSDTFSKKTDCSKVKGVFGMYGWRLWLQYSLFNTVWGHGSLFLPLGWWLDQILSQKGRGLLHTSIGGRWSKTPRKNQSDLGEKRWLSETCQWRNQRCLHDWLSHQSVQQTPRAQFSCCRAITWDSVG